MSMAVFIKDNLEPILADWESFAATLLPAAMSLDSTSLRNYAANMLKRAAEEMETRQTREQQIRKSRGELPDYAPDVNTSAHKHAVHRLQDAFTQEQLVSEFRALRASVVRHWKGQLSDIGESELEELTRFNEVIDQLLTEALAWYERSLQEARRQVSQALDQIEQRYRALADLSPDATLVSFDGSFVYVNEAAAHLLGTDSPDVLIGLSPFEIIEPRYHHLIRQSFRSVLSGQSMASTEYRWKRLDGSSVGVEVTAGPIPWDDGMAVQLIARDISGRNQAIQALRESEERFRFMADGLPLIVWVHDSEGAQEFVNQTFYEFFGVGPGDLSSDRWQSFMHPEDASDYLNEFLACTRQRMPFHAEVRVRRADGRWRWIESWGRPRYSPDGDYLGFVGTSADITTRKQTEEALRQSEAKLSAIIDKLPLGIGVSDQAGNILSFNPAALRLHGFASNDEILVHLNEYLDSFQLNYTDGSTMPASEWPLARAMRGEYVTDYEVSLRRPDGEERIVAYSAVPVPAEAEDTPLVVFVMQDITDKKHTQERLYRTLAQSEAIYDQMTEGLVIFDPRGNLLDMNPAALAIHGFDSVDTLRRHLNALTDTFEIHDLEGNRLNTDQWPIGRVLQGETFRSYEVRVRRPDTGRTWIGSYGGAPVYGPDGQIMLAVVTLRDITRQYEADAALSEAKQRLETVLTATEVGVWYWDIPNNRMRGDANMIKLFGLDPDLREAPLEVFAGQVHEQDREVVIAAVNDAVEEGGLYENEYRVVHPDGQVRWIHARGRVEKDPAGRATAFPGVAVDVTHRKQAEEALREADRRKDEFLATLAHELRNPLTPVQTGIELLRFDGLEPDVQEQTLGMMERQMSHLVRLVDDLLDVSRISRGKVSLRREQLDMVELVRNTLEACTASFPADRRVTVDMPSAPLLVEADPVRLSQIVANLMSNAEKYTRENGHIVVSVSREGNQACLCVRDDGIGLAPTMLDDVFTLFRQAYPGSTGGLGIGLTLVRSLVELHEGSVEARSEGEECGSEFIVRLPLSAEQRADTKAQTAIRPLSSMNGHRILVVDDNEDVAAGLAILLELQGARVEMANDGRSALQRIERFQPRMVFLDIGMPGMDGCEVARRIRSGASEDCPLLVAVTGWGQDEDRQRIKQAGFDFHLVKPVTVQDIQGVLGG